MYTTWYIEILTNIIFNRFDLVTVKLAQKIAWGLSNYAKCEFPKDDTNEINWILNATSVLLDLNETSVQSETCQIIINLTDNNEVGEQLIQFNIDNQLLNLLLKSQSEVLQSNCLKALGGILSSENPGPTNKFLTGDGWQILLQVLRERASNAKLREKGLWVISNLSADKNIYNCELFSFAVDLISTNTSETVTKELAFIIANTVNNMCLGKPSIQYEIQVMPISNFL